MALSIRYLTTATQMLLVCISIGCIVSTAASEHNPPEIVVQPKEEIVFVPDIEVELQCEASGDPNMTHYSWTKDGKPFNTSEGNRKPLSKHMGSFKFEQIRAEDKGSYQCFAENHLGRAMSQVAVLHAAFLIPHTETPVKHYNATVGEPLKVLCEHTKSYPEPEYSWQIAPEEAGQVAENVIPSERIQLDHEGNLYFTHVEIGDSSKIYMCVKSNTIGGLSQSTAGGRSQLNIYEGEPEETKPEPFHTPTDPIAVIGESITLQCVFSGNPAPTVKWTKEHGELPSGRHTLTDFGTTLEISDITEEDEGDYICTGTNKHGSEEHEVELEVQSKPHFKDPKDEPGKIDIVPEEGVELRCEAHGDPKPTVQWFINGRPVDVEGEKPHVTIEDDGEELVFHHLCDDCSNDTAVMAVQCNASNIHGYVYAQGYVNVFYGDHPSNNLGLVIGVLVAVFLIIIIVIVVVAVLCVRHKKKKGKGAYEVPADQGKPEKNDDV